MTSTVPAQARLPVLEMLRRYQEEDLVGLCCPGHHDGHDMDPDVRALLGDGALRCDVTQVPGIDDLLAPTGAIGEAQALAAETWGAHATFFLTNGTTSGVHAALLACCSPGDIVVASRASHRSVLEGLILSGARPAWIPCPVDPVLGCALPPTEEALRATLAALPGAARLAVLTRPTYHGDVASPALVRLLQACGTIVVVDEAWGAHLGFHPRLPDSACRLGADIVVNSTHKTCPAMSGGSMLHLCGDRVDAGRVAASVRLVTTTSPYYGVLVSLDGARRQMALHGRARLESILRNADGLRERLGRCEGIAVAGADRAHRCPGVAAFDEARVVFSATGRGWSGFDVEAALRENARVQVELADANSVIMLMAAGGDESVGERVEKVLRSLEPHPPRSDQQTPEWSRLPPPRAAMTPREAFFSPRHLVPLRQSRGRIAADVVCTYPPGIPLLYPGEEIGAEAIEVLGRHSALGGRTQGLASSPALEVQVTNH